MLASATGTETAGPVALPVAWSKNWTRTLPRSVGVLWISCCSLAFSAAATFWRLLGGGTRVDMVLGELEEEEILTAYQSLSELIAGVPNVTPCKYKVVARQVHYLRTYFLTCFLVFPML